MDSRRVFWKKEERDPPCLEARNGEEDGIIQLL
jgi:hypothetical protein